MVWITSDHHFNHKNIIKYVGRDFECTDDMDRCMIERWNSVVSEGDIVYHLGDFSMGLSEKEMEELVNELNGNIILIRGNHDRYGTKKLLKFGFKKVVNRLILDNYILTHRPIKEEDLNGRINIHGHIHNQSMDDERYVNVSVERHDYTPIKLSDVKKELKHESNA